MQYSNADILHLVYADSRNDSMRKATEWSVKHKIFSIWPITEKICQVLTKDLNSVANLLGVNPRHLF